MTSPGPSSSGTTSVAVLGLGNMGSALATALIANGREVSVWNRTPAKMERFSDVAFVGRAISDCVGDADLVISCLADYDSTREALADPKVSKALRDRVVVQLASGTPEEARDLAAWCESANVEYLDGKIFTYPSRIGHASSVIAYSGANMDVFGAHEMTLRTLAGNSRYISEDPGAASVLDLGWLATLYGATMGILQGVAFCEAQGVDIRDMFNVLPAWLNEIAQEGPYYQSQLTGGSFLGDQATLDVHLAAARHLQSAALGDGLPDDYSAFLVRVLGGAVDQGMGSLELAAAICALRG